MLKIKSLKKIGLLVISLILTACTSMQVDHSSTIRMSSYQKIAVLPFVNMTETPQADDRATSMTADLLRVHGMRNVVTYFGKQPKPTLIPGIKKTLSREKLLAWSYRQQADFAIIGGVTEWGYKVGLDGEPAIGVNLEIINVYTGQVVWTAVGSKSGGSRTALSDVALALINTMLDSIQFVRV